MTQVLTFVASLLLPNMVEFPRTRPGMSVLLVAATFSAGLVLTGWR